MPNRWSRSTYLSLLIVIINLHSRRLVTLFSNILLYLLHLEHDILIRIIRDWIWRRAPSLISGSRLKIQIHIQVFVLTFLFIYHLQCPFDQLVYTFVFGRILIGKLRFAVYLNNHLILFWSKLEFVRAS